MKRILFLNQMKLRNLNIIPSGTIYEILEVSKYLKGTIILAFSRKSKILYKKISRRTLIYAYPFNLSFKRLIIDLIRLILLIPRVLTFTIKLIKKFRIEYIRAEGLLIWGIIAYLIKKLLGIPYSIFIVADEASIISGKYPVRANHVIRSLINLLYRPILSNANNVATNAIPLYPLFKKLNKNTYFLPTYIDISRFKCEKEPFSTDQVTFLYVGRLDGEKGIDLLLRALKALIKTNEKFKFYIIGYGTYENLVKKLSLIDPRIEYIGPVDYEEMPKWYCKADAVILPSYTEAMPATIMEAMTCGRLVISSSVGSIPFLLNHGKYGILIKPGDANLLLEKLKLIINHRNKKALRDLASKGRKQIEVLFSLYKRNLTKHLELQIL